jgi:ABC-type sugar transport system ATPase subunit
VRAEHWQLSSAQSVAAEGYSASFTLQLGFVEQLGDSNVLYLSAAGQDGMFAMRVSAAAALPTPGQSVQVSLNLAHCHLFDADGQAVQRSQSVQPAC